MSNITINLKKDEVLIKIDDDVPQRKILLELSKKLKELKIMYQDEKVTIRVTGKVLTNKELEEIKKLIKKEMDAEVKFDTPTTLGLHSITRSYKKDVGKSETTFHRGSLRSGQKIEVEGSIVVIGDVNAGAEVIAVDNIAVIGNLRGLAHAGAKGNKDAIIAASALDVVQIRISNIVREIDRDEEGIIDDAFVYVDEDKIVIE